MNKTVLAAVAATLCAVSLLNGQSTRPASAPASAPTTSTAPSPKVVLNFDDLRPDALPDGWSVDTTLGTKLADWAVVADAKAPSAGNVLRIVRINDTNSKAFNLFWTRNIQLKDGTIQARIRADSGKGDQGGGVMWHVQDNKNYIVVRLNPLENNLRLAYVKDGVRTKIQEVTTEPIKEGQWFMITAVVKGDRTTILLDGKKVLDATDPNIPQAGGVGLWTKDDAASSFDDITIAPD